MGKKIDEKEERSKAEMAAKKEEAEKAGDNEAAEKYRKKQEEIAAEKLKEENYKRTVEESKKAAAEEQMKLNQRQPVQDSTPEVEPVADATGGAVEPDAKPAETGLAEEE